MLEVSNLSTSYGGLIALQGVSLRIDAGEVVAVLGVNGAGKSTLLKTIAGFHPAESGTIDYDGTPLHRMPAHAVARHGIA
nr:ATP-binding cassette domain-containing protein [Rhodospirillales bacterium]